MKKNLLFFVCFLLVIGFNYSTSFAQITLPYQQKFNSQTFPPFWAQTSTISPRWSISQTSNTGGTPNEMMASGTAGIGVSRLIVGPINTAGLSSLNLQFYQKMSCTDTANLSLRIQSSVNGANWTNEGFTLDENSFNCANQINILINNNLGSTTYIAWEIAGNHSLIDYWYIDDIIISQIYANDVGIVFLPIVVPVNSTHAKPIWMVKNLGTIAQSFQVHTTITNGFISIISVSNLAPGFYEPDMIWDPDNWPQLLPGIYEVTTCTQLIGDENPLNDCASIEFIVTADSFSISEFELEVNVNNSWNLVSVPGFHPDGQLVDLWWSDKDPTSSVYECGGGYQAVNIVRIGKGYWMKNLGNITYNTGDEWPSEGIVSIVHRPVVVNKGWNLIGGYESSFPTAKIFSIPPDIISAPVYGYDGGYGEADTLMPGFGYWVKATASGLLMIDTSCTNTPPQSLNKSNNQAELFKKEWGKIIITDAAGQNYTLYAVTTLEDLNRYELPPPPPAGVFDIRYSSGKITEDLSKSQSIEMNGVVYPVKIKVENMRVIITDVYNGEIDAELKPGEELIIHNSQINKLNVQSSYSNIPVAYSLEQNFPNPFNPSTKISWQAPTDGKQTLKVFDVLGNEVAVLIDEFRTAGRYQASFDAENLASGIYIYRLQAGEFIETKKMILMK